MKQSSGLLRIGLAATVWGSIAIFVRMVDASPFVIVFWRVTFAGAALLIYLLTTGKIGGLARLSWRTVAALVAVGALLAVNWILLLGALAMTKVAVAVLLGYTGPVFVAVLGPFITREAFERRIVLPLTLALVGTAIIVGLGELSVEGRNSVLGAIMAFCSALTYAGLMLTGKRLLRSVTAPILAFGQYAFAVVLLVPAALLMSGPSLPKEWGALTALGVVHTAAAILVFLSGLRWVRADRAAVMMYAEPVMAVIFAAIFLAEPLTWATAVGGTAVVAAGVLVARMSPTGGPEAPVVLEEFESAPAGIEECPAGPEEGEG